jgi:hypothetical protein
VIQPRRLVVAVATGDGLLERCLGDGGCAELARGAAAALGSLQALEDIWVTRVVRVVAELGDSRYIALSRLGEKRVLAVYVEGVSLGAAHLILRVLEEGLG